MPSKIIFTLIVAAILSAGCTELQVISQQEIAIQNRADAIVSGVLFEHELDTTASYNVRKDGFLVIKFDKSVPKDKYTEVVGILRSNPDIKGVRAEQSGREVCVLKDLR